MVCKFTLHLNRRTPTHLSLLVPDSSVEFFAVYADKVISRVDDATFSSNGPGCVNVITSHHSHRDARTLTLTNGIRHLRGTGTFVQNTMSFTLNTDQNHILWITQTLSTSSNQN